MSDSKKQKCKYCGLGIEKRLIGNHVRVCGVYGLVKSKLREQWYSGYVAGLETAKGKNNDYVENEIVIAKKERDLK